MVALKGFDIDTHYNSLRRGNLTYSFRGVLTKGLMDFVFDDIEEALVNKPERKIVRKRIFNVLVELIQNLYKNTSGSSLPFEMNEVMVIVQRVDNDYEVITGNFLEKDSIKVIEARMKMINYLTSEELDNLYRGVLSSGSITKKQGAGLGFIDIARRAKSNFDHQFSPVDHQYSFFTVKTLVKVA
ncbi:MAG: SiaB family protein kinase [Candidatus Cyclobacteriaceae bacterium M2_1C_046]